MHLGVALTEQVDGLLQIVSTGLNGELFLLKESLGSLLAVVDNLARLLQSVDMVGTQREENNAGSTLIALDGMQNADGIVHHPIGIRRHGKPFLAEALTDAVGKARTDEEQLLAGLYLEVGLRNIYYRTEFHRA